MIRNHSLRFCVVALSLTLNPFEVLSAEPPTVTAKAWAIADGETGEILWEHNSDERRKSASITKVMCALTVLKLAEKDPEILDEWVSFSELADSTYGSTAKVNAGESVQVRECLYGLLLPSGNDVGNALAEHFHPRLKSPDQTLLDKGLSNPKLATRANFIAEMNRQAKKLGMTDTVYRSSFGDGGTSQQMTTTAADLCILAHAATQNSQLREYVKTVEHQGQIRLPDGTMRIEVWKNTNQLLGLNVGYDGIKTGTTRSAGRCLMASGVRNGKRLHVITLGSDSTESRWSDSQSLFEWAWKELDKKED